MSFRKEAERVKLTLLKASQDIRTAGANLFDTDHATGVQNSLLTEAADAVDSAIAKIAAAIRRP